MAGIYIHIPFCKRKCIYCDFFSVGVRTADWNTFISALITEFEIRIKEISGSFNTLYIGGGTPSLMPDNVLSTLITGLKRTAGYRFTPLEVTIEVNPCDVDIQKARFWRSVGINRVSMGVQSFKDTELKAVGRRHTASDSMHAFKDLRTAGFNNISLDLIYGLPLQTLESLSDSLNRILDLRPEHISIYCLMYEEGTPLFRMRNRGIISESDDETLTRMQDLILKSLEPQGYIRYEISNYSLHGFESLHNSSYWHGIPYLGIGPAAHSYDGHNTRRSNPADIKSYISHFLNHIPVPFYNEENLDIEELREEYILTRLRTARGICLYDYAAKFGNNAMHRLSPAIRKWQKNGSLILDNGYLRLTSKGFMLSDAIILDLSL